MREKYITIDYILFFFLQIIYQNFVVFFPIERPCLYNVLSCIKNVTGFRIRKITKKSLFYCKVQTICLSYSGNLSSETFFIVLSLLLEIFLIVFQQCYFIYSAYFQVDQYQRIRIRRLKGSISESLEYSVEIILVH